MLKPLPFLPTEADLPETDNQPVDNELQVLIPCLLRAILALYWAERTDWFLGVNLGLYYDPYQSAIGPDGFLSLGVPRFRANGQLRLSYLIWQEGVVPQWVLEIVSKSPGKEYDDKFQKYAQIGVLYYVIYNPDYWQRDGHERFEVYRLVNGEYVRQSGNLVWMPELDLGIGCAGGTHEGITREWLYWYNEDGNRLLAPEDVVKQARIRTEQAELRAEQEWSRAQQAELKAEQERSRAQQAEQQLSALREKLQQQGIDPDTF